MWSAALRRRFSQTKPRRPNLLSGDAQSNRIHL
jgi:hypothetical protein